MPKSLSIHQNDGAIVLHGDDHGFENVDVPAVGDAQPQDVVGFADQAPAQWDSHVARDDVQNHRLPHPDCVSTFHGLDPSEVEFVRRAYSGARKEGHKWYGGTILLGAKY